MTDSSTPAQPPVPPIPPVPPTPPVAPMYTGAAKPSTILSMLSMIGGIVGTVLACCFGAGFLFAVAGIILGFLGKKKENAKGMAMTGIILGFVGAGLSILIWILLVASPALIYQFVPGAIYSSY